MTPMVSAKVAALWVVSLAALGVGCGSGAGGADQRTCCLCDITVTGSRAGATCRVLGIAMAQPGAKCSDLCGSWADFQCLDGRDRVESVVEQVVCPANDTPGPSGPQDAGGPDQ